MAAVIRLRPQMFEPERPEEQVEIAVPQSAPEARRWPLLATVLLAFGVSAVLWAGIAWLVTAIF